MIVQVDSDLIVFERKIQSLCKKPYRVHPKGCPNFGKKEGCPPGLSLIDKVLDFNKDVYVVYTEFNVGEFAESIRERYPDWTLRQIYNLRYWQPRARKFHRLEEERALDCADYIERFPEGRGVNITDLMSKVGVELNWNWPPEHNLENKTYIVSLAGTKIHTL